MKCRIAILFLACLLAAAPVTFAQDEPADAASDSLHSTGITRAVREDNWGPIPPPKPENTATLKRTPTPGWEKAVNVPYFIIGIPFRIVDFGVHQGISAADRIGFFTLPPGEHMGLRIPGDFYILPEVGISGLEGTTVGLNATRYDFLGPGNRLFIGGSKSTRQAEKLAIGTLFHLNEKADLQLGGGWSQLPQTKYYGLGPASDRDDLSFYNRISDWVGLEADYDLGRKLDLEFRAFHSRVESRPSRFEVDRALGDVHEGNLPPGYPGISRGYTWRLGLVRNNADETGRPGSGGLQKASISWFNDSDDSGVEYFTYTVDLQHFFPLWHTKRTMGVRGFFNRIDNRGDVEIPLTRMITFSRPDELRGFSSLRYYGLSSVGASVEYRWPVWVVKGREGPGLDAYLFTDIGQVYMDSREISMHNLEYTGGFGFRFIGGSQDFVGRFELGFSGEETVVTLKFSQNFQYDTKTFASGSDPTRRR